MSALLTDSPFEMFFDCVLIAVAILMAPDAIGDMQLLLVELRRG